MKHDCAHAGHVWLEPDGQPYRRHRARREASVTGTCQHCGLTAELPVRGEFTAPPGPHAIDKQIPPPFQEVLARALQSDVGPDRPDSH